MPGVSGPQLARQLEALQPGVPVLYTSGYTGETIADRGLFDADYGSEAVAKKIAADQEEGKKALVRGTPAFFVNGKMISGAQPFTFDARL